MKVMDEMNKTNEMNKKMPSQLQSERSDAEIKHIHILGICGTFMAGVAVLAKQLGFKVTGSDANVYPPMSTFLASQEIDIIQGYDPAQLTPAPHLVIIGNAMSRGNPCVEAVLNQNLPYLSGPQWLREYVLQSRWVLAVAGTHGKTTTSSMLAWVLEDCGYAPGFLIGGVPGNFEVSARLGDSPFFVVEADEYDSAFFDKRSKFVHYHPRTLIFNNLEFDHADIFEDLDAIKRQCHHMIRTIPSIGRIIAPQDDENIKATLDKGCWSELEFIGKEGTWYADKRKADGSEFDVYFNQELVSTVRWGLVGDHNVHNALMTIAAARHVGVLPVDACKALARFINTKRRLEHKGDIGTLSLYDDFAHHPTAIKTTLEGLRAKVGNRRILAAFEPRSNTMKLGVHKEDIAPSLALAEAVFLYQPEGLAWSLDEIASACKGDAYVEKDIDALTRLIVEKAEQDDVILVMSNGSFNGIFDKLQPLLKCKFERS